MPRTQRQGPAYAGRSEPGASGQSWRSSSLRGSSWLSSLLSTPNGNGGERGRAVAGKLVGRPRCFRIRSISSSSTTMATSFISPPQLPHWTGSTSKMRFRHAAQARVALLAASRTERDTLWAAASRPSTAKPASSSSHVAGALAAQVRARHEQGETFSQKMIKKVESEVGRFLYGMRMGIVEPVFANLRHMMGLDRFTLRGKAKVNIQWLLFSLVHNIHKVQRFGFAGAG